MNRKNYRAIYNDTLQSTLKSMESTAENL